MLRDKPKRAYKEVLRPSRRLGLATTKSFLTVIPLGNLYRVVVAAHLLQLY